MVSSKTSTQLLAYALTACLTINPAAMLVAMADSTFGADWKPTPLVDTNAPSPSKQPDSKESSPAKPGVSGASQAEAAQQKLLETRLKPAEPFIKDVESKLYLKPPQDASLVQRLNTIQAVLFGEPKYQDAGELLAKLAELFPQEAAKANAELNKQLQSSLPPVKTIESAKAKGKSRGKQVVQQAPFAAMPQSPSQATSSGYYPNPTTAQSTGQPAPKKKKGFWHDDWDSSFDNDPFFRDQPQGIASQSAGATANQSQGPSKLAAIGQGLAGLALMAGGVAGAYYMNKHGGNNYYPNNGYYGNGYYASPYGAYGPYGAYPYGSTTYNAYPGAYGSFGTPGYYGTPRTYTYTPYGSTYSNSTFGAISPLGVPTGVLPY